MAKGHSKSFTDEEQIKIARILHRISVSARISQHIMWELQYMFNELHDLGIELPKAEGYKDKIFKQSRDMSDSLIGKYDELIDWRDRPDESGKQHPIIHTYNNADGLLDVDMIIKQESDRMYDDCRLAYDDGSYDSFDIEIPNEKGEM